MKRSFLVAACAALVMSLWAAPSVRAQDEAIAASDARRGDPAPPPPSPARRRAEVDVRGGISTLYALDPLAGSLCFADGKDGRVFQKRELRNRCSDLDFGNYSADGLSVGVEGGRVGVIIDLGDANELWQRYRYPDGLGKAQGYASLHAEGDKVLILKEGRPQTFQELKESAQLFAEGKSVASAAVRVGHIYLIRLTDQHDKDFERLVKLKVISYVRGESVTIRWENL